MDLLGQPYFGVDVPWDIFSQQTGNLILQQAPIRISSFWRRALMTAVYMADFIRMRWGNMPASTTTFSHAKVLAGILDRGPEELLEKQEQLNKGGGKSRTACPGCGLKNGLY